MKRRPIATTAFVTALCLSMGAAADRASAVQAPATAAAQRPPQTFRAGTLLVEVDAIVTDDKGRFVQGLTPDDFEILEEGKPQKIEHMYVVTGTSLTASSGSSQSTEPASAASMTPAPIPSKAPPRVFVLFFDQEHLQANAFKRLRDAAIDFLTKEFKPGDVGGVVIAGKMAGNQLTSDREALLTAVRNAQPTSDKTSRRLDLLDWPRFNSETEAIRIALSNDRDVLDQVVRRACQDDPNACRMDTPEAVILGKARTIVSELRPPATRTVRTLQALSTGLARLSGRKTVILMTEGFFVEEAWADLHQIVGAAARSNVRIYSLDARGLDTRGDNLRQMGGMDPGGGMALEAYNTIEDGPNSLALDTGGYVIRHTNKFADALAEIAQDTSNYYVIGYSPSNVARDGSFRRIALHVKRPGLKVRARRGYVAAQPTASPPASPAGEDAHETAAAPSTAPTAAPASGTPSTPAGASGDVAAAPDAHVGVPTAAATSSPTAEPAVTAAVVLRPDSSDRVRALASHEQPEGGKTFASEGWERYQKGDLDGAAKWLGKAAADPGARPWVRYALGYTALGLGHAQQAAQEWEKVRLAVPEFTPVYLDLADAYGQVQNYGQALNVLKAAAARWPDDVDVLNAMGTIQVKRGALDDAIKTFTTATDAKPKDGLAFFNLARTYELRYFKTRRFSPTDSRWIGNAADLKHAIESYERYVRLGGPYDTSARQALQNLQWVK